MSKPKILYILNAYPQWSESYIKVEVEALQDKYDLSIISLHEADLPFKNPHPYHVLSSYEEVFNIAQTIKPDVIHSHWISSHLKTIYRLAKDLSIPFTLRSHSFDTLFPFPPLWKQLLLRQRCSKGFKELIDIINSDYCLGVLGFPYGGPRLSRAGLNPAKYISCPPVVNYEMFYNREGNGESILNLGACLPKKKFESYIELALLAPNLDFNLYALGYFKTQNEVIKFNEKLGRPVNICTPVEHIEMPSVYKKHRWLVYTANPKLGTIGWPIAVAEAQAAGVGVCFPNLRPDIQDYLGGAGILYSSLTELVDIISQPVPEEMREKGFEVAKKSDIKTHLHRLTDLWPPSN